MSTEPELTITEVNILKTELQITSKYLNREVTYLLYLPDMDSTGEPLHLLLLNDGQDLDTMAYDQILKNLYLENKIKPVLSVGIKAGDRLQEYGVASKKDFKGRGSRAGSYQQFILEELLPAIYENTQVETFASYAIAGFSMGGLSAFDVAWNHPEIFNKVGAFSGSFWWRSKNLVNSNPDRFRIAHKMVAKSQTKPDLKFWFMAGSQEEKSDRNRNGIIDAIDDTTGLIWELLQKGFDRHQDIQYVELIGGRHDMPTWGKMMPKFLTWAYKKDLSA